VASAQTDPVKFTLRIASGAATVAPGSTFRVELTAKLDEGRHLYSITQPPGGPIATRITVTKGQPVTLVGAIEAPQPRVVFDQNFGMDTELYDGEAKFVLQLKLAADTSGRNPERLRSTRTSRRATTSSACPRRR
jgi:thiol:disulfide interchange protein DsbD